MTLYPWILFRDIITLFLPYSYRKYLLIAKQIHMLYTGTLIHIRLSNNPHLMVRKSIKQLKSNHIILEYRELYY